MDSRINLHDVSLEGGDTIVVGMKTNRDRFRHQLGRGRGAGAALLETAPAQSAPALTRALSGP